MDFKQNIAQELSKACGLGIDEIISMIEIPPNAEMGDYAFPCFKLAKSMRKAPAQIAADLCSIPLPQAVRAMEAKGPYVNFFMDRAAMAKETLTDVLSQAGRYGSSQMGAGKTVCLDFSSINIAKPFHIGHLSSTVIGAALANIYRFLGYRTVSINHLGDWGTQFGKLIVAYRNWSNKEAVEGNSVDELLRIYVKFHQEAEKNPALNDEARAWFKRIEDGDPEASALMEWFKELTLQEANKIYDELGITFDSYAGESFYNDKMAPIVEELAEKKLLQDSEGAKVVDLEAFGMPPCLILKSDGATLYATRDIAAAVYRKNTYDFDKCLYVVAYQQNLHFKQWFKVVELMGHSWASQLEHVAFGMVSVEDGTLSTRQGKVVLLKDVLNTACDKALEIILEKNPGLENKETISRQIGIGAVVFSVLFNNRIKDISFSFDRVLNFDGETGPYVQYTHARCCSVLKKAQPDAAQADYSALTSDEASELIKSIYAFPQAVIDAGVKNEPSLVTRQIVAIAQQFNKFYYEHRILDESNPAATNARLLLTDCVRTVLKTGLGLLGIAAPERM